MTCSASLLNMTRMQNQVYVSPRKRCTQRLRWVPFLLAIFLVCGCGRRAADSPLQDQVDFTDASNLFSAPIPPPAQRPEPDTVLAVVDSAPITFADLEKEVNVLLVNAGRANLPPEQMAQYRDRLSEQAMQNLVIKRLLAEAIDQENVVVTDEEVALQIENFRQSLPEDLSFEALLKRNQLTETAFLDDLRLSMRVERLLQSKVQAFAPPDDEAVEAYYQAHPEQFAAPERVTLRHLLVQVPQDAAPELRGERKAHAEALLQELETGADFAALAAEHSDDLPNREQGGLLPNVTRGQLPPALEARVFSMEPDADIVMVETHFGFHLVQVLARHEAGAVPLEDARATIASHLLRLNQKAALETYVNQLKDEASISFHQP